MPYRRAGSYRRGFGRRRGAMSLNVINSVKNVFDVTASTGTTLQASTVAVAKDSPVTTASNEVGRGSMIRAIWCSFDVCGLAATGVLQRTGLYLMKNPGNNLSAPGVFTVGTSNEKKFVIKQWQFMTMRNQDGNPPFHWEGWIKIPKRYHRMGTDDIWQFAFQTDSAAGHYSAQFIYKWFS